MAFYEVVLTLQLGDVCFQELLYDLAALNDKGQRVTKITFKVFFFSSGSLLECACMHVDIMLTD